MKWFINLFKKKINTESANAYASISENKEQVRQQVYKFIRTRPKGVTADEVAEIFECSHNHVSPRISELKRDGWLRESAERRSTRSGRKAAVLYAISLN